MIYNDRRILLNWAYYEYLEEVEIYGEDYLVPIDPEIDSDNDVDVNDLYDCFRASLKGSDWKAEPQKFEIDWLCELFRLKREIISQVYQSQPGSEFILNERGKIRYVHGRHVRDRVIGHWLCDTKINPAIEPYLIFNNGASQKGKGLSFARQMFEKDLHNYYLRHGNNDGFAGFVDMSKFYDNIRHEDAKEIIGSMMGFKNLAYWVFSTIIDVFQIDVSYMSDEEYAHCMDKMFNSIEYNLSVPKSFRTGQKMMPKSVDIGDQVSQSIGIVYPFSIDNYIKIVRSCKENGRYMDDIYIVGETREFVESIVDGVEQKAQEIGLFINKRKTRIVKLCQTYQYLQVKYSLSESGRVIKRINPKSVTRERRRLKAYRRLLDNREMEYEDIEQAARSWMGTFAKLMSKKQIKHMKTLYYELFGKELSWKRK